MVGLFIIIQAKSDYYLKIIIFKHFFSVLKGKEPYASIS